MSIALLFAGQGTLHPAMLPWIDDAPAAQPVLQAMQRHVGPDWRVRLGDPAWRRTNAIAQPLVVGTALAAWAVLQAQGAPPPAVVAGYSVGELAAAAAAGALDPVQAVDLAATRARAMDDAVAGVDTGLLSATGLEPARLEALRQAHGLAVAIRLADDQVVLGGPATALDEAARALAAAGARCRRLEVALASHTPWMAAAVAPFAARLAALPMRAPRCPIALDATGSTARALPAIREALAQQLACTVAWSGCLQAIHERQPAAVLELGAGDALARGWQGRYPGVPCRALDDFRSAQGVQRWLEQVATGRR